MMDEVGVRVTRDVRPFWGRVTIVESPVDQEQTPSGLIVPLGMDSGEKSDPVARRGIVKALEPHVFDEGTSSRDEADLLTPGTVVYFRRATRLVGDVLIVEFSDILAFEP